MKRWVGICAAVSVMAASPVLQSIQTPGGLRGYLLLKPEVKGPLPLVILLHGHGGSARQALTQGPLAAWTTISAREGVMVASLDGVKGPDGHQGWNDCRGDASGNPKTDDVAFVKAVIQRLEREAGADSSRVYLMGMSNGAMMTLRLGLQLDPAPAAICAVCGLMSLDGPCGGSAARPVPALLIEGTADPLVPFEGGQVHFFKQQRGGVVSAAQTVAFWRKAEGLDQAQAVDSVFPHLDNGDPTRAEKSVWGAAGGPQVEFIRIEGGGHAEPTLAHPYGALYRAFTGKQNHDFESAEEAWAFFKDEKSK
ncbi:MAG TPA: PHB depolymerase family esterase [Holophagaceae bacterium]|jgi:polyhydroxybutyrate depolymerase|nr:PHB depolymerase family esterase [Holophagaceae bacterium]